MSDETPEPPDPERWWRHRRRMGWVGVAGLVLIPAGSIAAAHWLAADTVEAVQSVVISSVWACLGLAITYAGGASLVDAMARLRHGDTKR